MNNDNSMLNLIDEAVSITSGVMQENQNLFSEKSVELDAKIKELQEYRRRVTSGEIDLLSTIPYGTKITGEYIESSPIFERAKNFPPERREKVEKYIQHIKELIDKDADQALLYNIIYALEAYIQKSIFREKQMVAIGRKVESLSRNYQNSVPSRSNLNSRRSNTQKQENLFKKNEELEKELRILCRKPNTPKEQIDRLREEISTNNEKIESYFISNIELIDNKIEIKEFYDKTLIDESKLKEQENSLNKMILYAADFPHAITEQTNTSRWDKNIFPNQNEKESELLEEIDNEISRIDYYKGLLTLNTSELSNTLKDMIDRNVPWQDIEPIFQQLHDVIELDPQLENGITPRQLYLTRRDRARSEKQKKRENSNFTSDDLIEIEKKSLEELKKKMELSEENIKRYESMSHYSDNLKKSLISKEIERIATYQELYQSSSQILDMLPKIKDKTQSLSSTEGNIIRPEKEFNSALKKIKTEFKKLENIRASESEQHSEDSIVMDSSAKIVEENGITETKKYWIPGQRKMRNQETSKTSESAATPPSNGDDDNFDFVDLSKLVRPTLNPVQDSISHDESLSESRPLSNDTIKPTLVVTDDDLEMISGFVQASTTLDIKGKAQKRKASTIPMAAFLGIMLATVSPSSTVYASTSQTELESSKMTTSSTLEEGPQTTTVANEEIIDQTFYEVEKENKSLDEINNIKIGDKSDKVQLEFVVLKGAISNGVTESKNSKYMPEIDENKILSDKNDIRVIEFAAQDDENTVISSKLGQTVEDFMKENDVKDINQIQFKIGYSIENDGQFIRPAKGKIGWISAEDVENGYRFNSENVASKTDTAESSKRM